jgi:exopolysaccharide biosynthesis polyprenyl glycosylphosphotransferase
MTDVHNVFASPSATISGNRKLHGRFGASVEARRIGRWLAVGGALMLGDFVASLMAIITSRNLVALTPWAHDAAEQPHLPFAALLLVFLTLGLYAGANRSPYGRFRARAVGILLFIALDLLLMGKVGGMTHIVLSVICSTALLFAFGFYMELFVRSLLIQYGLWTKPTALVGCGETAQRLFRTLAAEPELGFKPIGFIRSRDDDEPQHGALPAPVLGSIDAFADIAGDVEVAILTSRKQLPIANAISDRLPPAQLILVNDAQDIQTLWLRVRTLGNAVGIQFEWDPLLRHNRLLKRVIDLCIAIPVAIVFLPLILALALVIIVVDPGWPFYVQPRVGWRGRLIKIPKLRTMYRDASRRLDEHLDRDPAAKAEWERFFKLSNDPRILPVIGNFIRRASIDELPQLWSVIIGTMSLVGPRPFPQYHMNSFDAEFQHVRTIVPPGLTGLWQVTARSNGDLTVQRAHDLTYIRNWSVLLDLYILFQTVPAVMSFRGAK